MLCDYSLVECAGWIPDKREIRLPAILISVPIDPREFPRSPSLVKFNYSIVRLEGKNATINVILGGMIIGVKLLFRGEEHCDVYGMADIDEPCGATIVLNMCQRFEGASSPVRPGGPRCCQKFGFEFAQTTFWRGRSIVAL